MQSSLVILSSSFPVAKLVAGSVMDAEADGCGGFGRVLAGEAAAGEDETAVDSPSGAEAVVAAANPVLLWAGAVAGAGGVEEPGPAQAVVLIDAAGRSGIRCDRPPPVAQGDAASVMAWSEERVPWWPGASGESEAMPTRASGRQLAGTELVEPVAGKQPGRMAGASDDPEGVPGGETVGSARGMTEPASQLEIPEGIPAALRRRSGHDPADVPGQAGAGGTDASPVESETVIATGIDDGFSAMPTRSVAGFVPSPLSVPSDQTAAVSLPAPAHPKAALGGTVFAAQVEGMKAGTAMLASEGMAKDEGGAGKQVSASENTVQGAAQAGTGGRPQASFWERLHAGMNDAKAPATAADEASGPVPIAGPAARPEAPQVSPAGSPLPIMPVGSPVTTRPGAIDPGAPVSTGGPEAQPASKADPAATDRGLSEVAPRVATVKTGLPAPSEPGPMPVPDQRVATPGPDPMPVAFDTPLPFAQSGATPFTPQAGPVPAVFSGPMPQLTAQLTTALTGGTDGETELALSPAELGHVRVKLKPDAANPDRLVVMITFERPETLDLFRRHAGELSDALRAAGYSGADLGFGQQGSGQPDADRRDRTATRSFDDIPRSDPAGPPQPAPRHSGAASLDLRL